MGKELYFIAISTSVGVLIDGIIWSINFFTNTPQSLEFSGGDGYILSLFMVAGGSIFGLSSIAMYYHKNKSRSALKTFSVFMVSGLMACLLVGFVISQYAISSHGHCVEEGPNDTCLDEKSFFLFS